MWAIAASTSTTTRSSGNDSQPPASKEPRLAGRGLYGDYAIFFPADSLAIGSNEGLVLPQVEDILLRLDYVSVAR